MSATKRRQAKDYLYLVDKYAARASTRNEAFRLASIESGISETALRVAWWRATKGSPRRSLKYAFSEEEENLLEAACVIHARQGVPLSCQNFASLLGIFRSKK